MTDSRKKIQKTEEEWQDQLTSEQYRVTRMKGTERPFSGEYHDNKEEGIYRCVACGTPLFSSESKYDSGTGWPSFWEPVDAGNVETEEDRMLFMRRTEVQDRKSTRLNSSHANISYAVFCLKKKK